MPSILMAFALWASLSAVSLLVTACSGRGPEPVKILLNEDICSHCRMAISERQFAAELVTLSGRVELFDDIGCLVSWIGEHQSPLDAAAFVTDYSTLEWLRAEDSVYVQSSRLSTPMGHGLVAFASPEAARSFRSEIQGQLLSWEQLTETDS